VFYSSWSLGGLAAFGIGVILGMRWVRLSGWRSWLLVIAASIILALVGVMLTALTVAREWERGSMEQLFATPVGRLEIVLGKLLPYMVIGCIGVLLSLTVGAWVFDVPIRGSLTLLALDSLLFITGIGLGMAGLIGGAEVDEDVLVRQDHAEVRATQQAQRGVEDAPVPRKRPVGLRHRVSPSHRRSLFSITQPEGAPDPDIPRPSPQHTVRCRSMQVARTSSGGRVHQSMAEKISTS
jgi:hypothetical protein